LLGPSWCERKKKLFRNEKNSRKKQKNMEKMGVHEKILLVFY
jgi:hypothetical protein